MTKLVLREWDNIYNICIITSKKINKYTKILAKKLCIAVENNNNKKDGRIIVVEN